MPIFMKYQTSDFTIGHVGALSWQHPSSFMRVFSLFHIHSRGRIHFLLRCLYTIAIRTSFQKQQSPELLFASCLIDDAQCLIQDKISTNYTGPYRTDRRTVAAPRGRRIGRYYYLIILPLLIILLSLKSNLLFYKLL